MTAEELEKHLNSTNLPAERKEALKKILMSLPIKPGKGARFYRLALIPVGIEHHPKEPDERQYLPFVDTPIWLDDPKISAKVKRDFYTVLARIPEPVPPAVRNSVVTHGLGRSVAHNERAAAKLQTAIYRDAIARYKEAGIKAPFKKLAALTGVSVKALKQRLRPGRAK
jgi:hypothetical protein